MRVGPQLRVRDRRGSKLRGTPPQEAVPERVPRKGCVPDWGGVGANRRVVATVRNPARKEFLQDCGGKELVAWAQELEASAYGGAQRLIAIG